MKNSYHPYAMTTIFFWSLAYVFTRMALEYFPAAVLGFLRYFIASCALCLVVLILKIKPPAKKDWGWFLLSGATGFFLYMIFFNVGTTTVTASTSSVVIASVPVLTALLARLFFREKLRARQWAAIAIEFAGIAVLTLVGGVFSANMGVLWLLLAAVSLSAYNLIQRKITKKYSALQSSAYSIFAGTCMLAVFIPASVEPAMHAPFLAWFYLIIMGVFSSALAYVCWSKAFEKAEKTSSVSNYMFITPLLTTLLGFLLAGEVPDASTIAGGAVVLFGSILFNWRPNEKSAFEKQKINR